MQLTLTDNWDKHVILVTSLQLTGVRLEIFCTSIYLSCQLVVRLVNRSVRGDYLLNQSNRVIQREMNLASIRQSLASIRQSLASKCYRSLAHMCVCVCVCVCVCARARARVCKGGQAVWVERLTVVEWHINECTACNLQYKAQALVWCPFILISLHSHSPTWDNISSAAELLHMRACHIASDININDTAFSPVSMDIQMRGVCRRHREKREGHSVLAGGKDATWKTMT